jgi:hypothetical protein
VLTSETFPAKLLILALVWSFAPLANIAAPPMREYDTFSLQEAGRKIAAWPVIIVLEDATVCRSSSGP